MEKVQRTANGHSPALSAAAPLAFRKRDDRVQVRHAGTVVAESATALTVFELGHTPVIYFPRGDVHLDLFARVDRSTDAPREAVDVRVERFRVRRDLPSYPALRFGEPARVTWSDVLVPADAPWLVVHVGESYRLAFEDVDAPPVRATVTVDGVPVAVARIDGRRRDEDRRWFELSADLSDRAGERVRVAFEVAPQRSDVPEGTSASSDVLLVGFADPRFSPEPLAGSEPAPKSDGR